MTLKLTADELGLNQEKVHEQSLGPELARLRSQIAAEQLARTEEQKTSQLRAQEAHDRVREAETAAQYSEAGITRVRNLHAEKLLADRDLEKAEGDAAKLRAAVVTLESAASQIRQEQATRDRERDIRLQQLQEEIAKLEDERDTRTEPPSSASGTRSNGDGFGRPWMGESAKLPFCGPAPS